MYKKCSVINGEFLMKRQNVNIINVMLYDFLERYEG